MGLASANSLTWEELKKMLIEEYFPQEEMKRLEKELWNLTRRDVNISTYTNRFNDLKILFPNFVNPEYKKVERYIGGLVQSIQGFVTTFRPSTYDSAKSLAYNLIKQ